MRKRIISLILALSVMFSCLPVQAFAGNDITLPDIAVEESLPDDSANGLPSDIGNTQEIPRPAEQPEAAPERTEEPEVTDTPAAVTGTTKVLAA